MPLVRKEAEKANIVYHWNWQGIFPFQRWKWWQHDFIKLFIICKNIFQPDVFCLHSYGRDGSWVSDQEKVRMPYSLTQLPHHLSGSWSNPSWITSEPFTCPRHDNTMLATEPRTPSRLNPWQKAIAKLNLLHDIIYRQSPLLSFSSQQPLQRGNTCAYGPKGQVKYHACLQPPPIVSRSLYAGRQCMPVCRCIPPFRGNITVATKQTCDDSDLTSNPVGIVTHLKVE